MACGARLGGLAGSDERKPVTILFTDVAGSTALGERLEPEAVRNVMLRYFEATASVVERHGGIVEKFIGDAVMAVFGAPVALEDHAARAVRAALELQEELARLNSDLRRELGTQIAVRTGVNSGDVVSGDAASGQALVTGDAVNVAARLQQAAAAGETLIGDATRRLAGPEFNAEPIEPLAARGKSKPVAAWRLLADGGRPTADGDTPMHGRERELRRLREAFERVCFERKPQRVVVLGAAGIGKSRLTRELVAALSDRATVLVGRCPPYGEGITFWALGEIVRQMTGDIDPRVALERLLAGSPQPDLTADRVLQAAGLEEATASREDLTRAVRDLFESVARQQPVVLVLEDLHWAEPALLDLAEYLLERTRDAPLMLVCAARPDLADEHPEWARETESSAVLELGPLSDSNTWAMIRGLLPADAATDDVRERLAERAEGNPLFIQQMIAFLREQVPGADVKVPPTIHALLAARLDRLSGAERRAIGAASVVGRDFWAAAVAALGDAAAESALETLVRKQLVVHEPTTFEGETGFAFSHILIRDAAYESITKEDRARLHEQLADWLEQRHPQRMIEIEAILGNHLERAYRYRSDLGHVDEHSFALAQRGARHLAAAGRRAVRAREDTAAAALLERAGSLLPASARERLELLPAIGESLEGAAAHARAGDIYEEALERALAARERSVEGLARLGRAHVWFVAHPEITAEQITAEAEHAIRLLEHTGEERGLADAWRLLGEARMYDGRARDGQEALEHALEHVDPARLPRHWNAICFAMGMCLLDGPAPLPVATEFAEQRLAAARERSMSAMEADMLHVLGVSLGRRARFDEARDVLTESIAVSEDMGLLYMSQWAKRSLGRMELSAGDPDAAERALRESWDVLTQMGLHSSLGETAVPLAEALYAQGRHDEADAVLKALKDEWAGADASISAPRLAVRAKLLAAQGWTRLAEESADRALRTVRNTDWLCLQADTLLAHAEVMQAAGRERDALASAERALSAAETKGYEAVALRARAVPRPQEPAPARREPRS